MKELEFMVCGLIDKIRQEDIEEDYCPAIDYINEQLAVDNDLCIEMIKEAFAFDDYRYAESVIWSALCSDIDCLTSWYKDLLLKAKELPRVSEYAQDLYDLYRDVFDKI